MVTHFGQEPPEHTGSTYVDSERDDCLEFPPEFIAKFVVRVSFAGFLIIVIQRAILVLLLCSTRLLFSFTNTYIA